VAGVFSISFIQEGTVEQIRADKNRAMIEISDNLWKKSSTEFVSEGSVNNTIHFLIYEKRSKRTLARNYPKSVWI
jgi:hypothetical protein